MEFFESARVCVFLHSTTPTPLMEHGTTQIFTRIRPLPYLIDRYMHFRFSVHMSSTHVAIQWPLSYTTADAPAPAMTAGVHLAGADPAGAASAPSGVGDGMQMQHHQPSPAERAQVGPDETRAGTHTSDKDVGGGSRGNGGNAGDAGGEAAADSALRDAHRRACSHETHATTRERRTGWGE